MRISDWSSDVCSSDLDLRFRQAAGGLRFVCHNGISHEIVYGRGDGAPYQPASDVTGFVTGEGGMGHTAWLIPDIAAMDRLMLGALGMTLREEISAPNRSEEHTSELQSLMRISYAVFCLQKKNTTNQQQHITLNTAANHNE